MRNQENDNLEKKSIIRKKIQVGPERKMTDS